MTRPGIDDVPTAIREFIREREWEQFHSPENLATSISIEAARVLKGESLTGRC